MADTKITDLTELAVEPATDDLLAVVDVSDTTMSASGTNKKAQYTTIRSALDSRYVQQSLFDANTIIKADSDNTPEALTVAEDRIVGRLTGEITVLTGTQVTGILDDMVGDSGAGGTAGLAPAPGAGDAAAGKYLKASGAWDVPAGVSDHGALSGLDDDDHSQYHNDARGDARYAASSHNHAASDINSGTLAHERGGLEFDASAVAEGDIIVGTGVGTMGLLAASGASDGDVPTIQADGSVAWEAPPGGVGGSMDIYENGVSVVETADKLDFKDANVEDAGSSDAAVYLNLPHVFMARMTLETGVPVSTSDQTAKTVVYLTPYLGNKISLYDGTRWKLYSLSEISIKTTDVQTGDTTNTSAVVTDLTDTSQFIVGMAVTGVGIAANSTIASIDSATQVTLNNAATDDGNDVSLTFKVVASKVLDIFVYPDSGTPKLEMVAWTDGSTRATAITTQDSIYAKDGDTTRRLVGTICTTATAGQTEVSSSFCGVSNAVNRVYHAMMCQETTDTWTYSTATWRSANNGTTLGVNRIGFVDAIGDVFVRATNVGMAAHSSGFQAGSCGVGINSTSTNSAYLHGQIFYTSSRLYARGIYAGHAGAGYTFIQRLEIASGVNTTTWVGDAGLPELKTGMEVIIEY